MGNNQGEPSMKILLNLLNCSKSVYLNLQIQKIHTYQSSISMSNVLIVEKKLDILDQTKTQAYCSQTCQLAHTEALNKIQKTTEMVLSWYYLIYSPFINKCFISFTISKKHNNRMWYVMSRYDTDSISLLYTWNLSKIWLS